MINKKSRKEPFEYNYWIHNSISWLVIAAINLVVYGSHDNLDSNEISLWGALDFVPVPTLGCPLIEIVLWP
tara:strand:- start:523 stop:735 length:213 start_codon:yes stop_codon:yes gene_type:complete